MDEYFIEEKSTFDKVMDLLVFLAVFVVTVFFILDVLAMSGKASLNIITLNTQYFYVNLVIFVIFLVDLYRLWNKSTDRRIF